MQTTQFLTSFVCLFMLGCSSAPTKEESQALRKAAESQCKSGERKPWEDLGVCTDRTIYTVAKDQCRNGKKQGGESLSDCAKRISGRSK